MPLYEPLFAFALRYQWTAVAIVGGIVTVTLLVGTLLGGEATGRLALIIPLTLLVIAMLVYSSVKNWKDTLVVLAGIPVACTGGILALLVTRTNFSISAAMGFIVIGGALILAVLPRLLQPSLLVLAHRREARWAIPPIDT